MRLTNVRGHHIWTAPLGKDTIVVDAGAHRGEFSSILRGDYGCRCIMVEANPNLTRDLEKLEVGLVLNAALAREDGQALLQIGENLESSSILGTESETTRSTVEVETISLETLLERANLHRIDLLKLDIEGAEFELIAHTSDRILQQVQQITVEFHDFLPHFAKQRLFEKAQARMQDLGFVTCLMSFRTHGDVLFLNQKHFCLTRVQIVRLRYLSRFESRLRSPSAK